MSKTISVIIPVYNVEKYVGKCIESLLGQTYRDLEIILIDDGSTDSSGAICDEYGNRDARIKVIHQSNGGAAAAKNAGLKIASGDYITFADSDDYVEPKAYETMLSVLEKNSADVVQCNHRDVYDDYSKNVISITEQSEMTGKEYLELFVSDWTCSLLWDKLYKSEFVKNLRFVEGRVIDDEFFTYKVFFSAKKIIRIPDVLYNYRKRNDGAMLNPDHGERIIYDKMEYVDVRRKEVSKHFPELSEKYDTHFVAMHMHLLKDKYATNATKEKTRSTMKNYLKEKNHISISFRTKLELLKSRI